MFSVNEKAAEIMGSRDVASGVVIMDEPCELGYWCPVCKVPPLTDSEYDDRLEWSEYNGFLWCRVCDKDYPSALCVPLDANKDQDRDHINAGIDDAIDVFLATVRAAIARSNT